MTMRAWRDLGHGWVVGNQSVVSGLTACVPLLQLPPLCCSSVSLWAENHKRLHADCVLRPQMIWENLPRLMLYLRMTSVFPFSGFCVVLLVRQCLFLPLRSLWHGPSLSWSPGYPGWSIPVGQGESLPQNGWSYVSRNFHLKNTHFRL